MTMTTIAGNSKTPKKSSRQNRSTIPHYYSFTPGGAQNNYVASKQTIHRNSNFSFSRRGHHLTQQTLSRCWDLNYITSPKPETQRIYPLETHTRSGDEGQTKDDGESHGVCLSDTVCRAGLRSRGRTRGLAGDGNSSSGRLVGIGSRLANDDGRDLSIVLANAVGDLGVGSEGDVGTLSRR